MADEDDGVFVLGVGGHNICVICVAVGASFSQGLLGVTSVVG